MTTNSSWADFKIEKATKADIPTILHFIRALADYEKLLSMVEANEERLEQTLFCDNPVAEVVIGYYQKKPVGFALFFQNYSTFLAKPGLYLEDLFIDPEYRGYGFGKALFCYVAAQAKARGCGRYEWSVLDWNEPARKFYTSLGASEQTDWLTNRLTGPSLDKVADLFENEINISG